MSHVKGQMLFNDGIAGTGIYDSSARFRMYLICFVGIFALGSVLFWRAQLLLTADYVEFPKHKKEKNSGLVPQVINTEINN